MKNQINEIIENSKILNALVRSKYKNQPNRWNLKSGRYECLPRFTKCKTFY
jgi:hypothetical protein